MKPLYTEEEYNNSKSTQKLPCQCYYCGGTFHKMKKYITSELKLNKGEIRFCSQKCLKLSRRKRTILKCDNCNVEFEKLTNQIRDTNFCSNSCQATYMNKNKKYGIRRSKLEIWLEERLTDIYPNLYIDYNGKGAIGSELDIYIPSLNLAIELNGIFHYEPIYGVDKLQKIQENDQSKSKACHDNQIDLCVIDTSGQKYVKPKSSQKYLNIITQIINGRLLTS